MANDFVRVRLSRIEGLDLSLFEFDLDLTLMMFFLNAEDKIYARYGGRDGADADNRQSLAGLRYTMQLVLEMHRRKDKVFAPRDRTGTPFTGRGGKGCMHCHNAKERQHAELQRSGKWDRSFVFRYPLPDNLGMILEVDRGNVIRSVKPDSPAAKAGLQKGDIIRTLAGVPIHSFGDAQFALDRARKEHILSIGWQRSAQSLTARLELSPGWSKTDLGWRRSMRRWVPSLHLDGKDLTADEKKALGLSPTQLAYRLRLDLHPHVKRAGIKDDDIILGIDDIALETNVNGFYDYVIRQYLAGDQVAINVLRGGQKLKVPMTLISQ